MLFTNQTFNVHKQEINCSTWQLRKLIHELAKLETLIWITIGTQESFFAFPVGKTAKISDE
jgi:hypothetical protein